MTDPLHLDMPAPATGPRGGDLENPRSHPQHRRAELNPLGGDGLHRFTDSATVGVKNEQAWHHMAAYMVADGRANIEIAEAAGVSVGYISMLRQQRWFLERVSKITLDRGRGIAARLEAEADASLDVMLELRDGAENERVRYSAAKDLVELAHGKAVQKVLSVSATTSFSSPDAEMQNIMTELQNLRAAREQSCPQLATPESDGEASFLSVPQP